MGEEQPERVPDLAAVAAESSEDSTRREREILGDQPDTGDLVPQDEAQ